ncbi:unnamed protein product, partial [marine sediment metagenome]
MQCNIKDFDEIKMKSNRKTRTIILITLGIR